MIAHMLETLLTKRRPNRKGEGFGIIENGDVYMTTNEKMLLIHNALIRRELHPVDKFVLRHDVAPRSVKTETQRCFAVLQATNLTFPSHSIVKNYPRSPNS